MFVLPCPPSCHTSRCEVWEPDETSPSLLCLSHKAAKRMFPTAELHRRERNIAWLVPVRFSLSCLCIFLEGFSKQLLAHRLLLARSVQSDKLSQIRFSDFWCINTNY